MSTYHDGIVFMSWIHQGEVSIMTGLNVRNYLFEHHHRTHEFFSEKIERMCAQNARGVLSVREPLDILVSVSNKVARYGLDVLGSEELFRYFANGIKSYYQSFMPAVADGRYIPIRHEDLLNDFERTIEKLCDVVRVAYSKQDAAKLKEGILYKNIGLEGHLWKPGAGKWRQYLSQRHLEISEDVWGEELHESLGYAYPAQTEATPTHAMDVKPLAQNKLAYIPAFLAHCGRSLDEALRLTERYGELYTYKANELLFISSSRKAADAFSLFLEESDFMNAVAAAHV